MSSLNPNCNKLCDWVVVNVSFEWFTRKVLGCTNPVSSGRNYSNYTRYKCWCNIERSFRDTRQPRWQRIRVKVTSRSFPWFPDFRAKDGEARQSVGKYSFKFSFHLNFALVWLIFWHPNRSCSCLSHAHAQSIPIHSLSILFWQKLARGDFPLP